MTVRYCQHGLSTGNNDGTSWEDAYQLLSTGVTWLNGASVNDELWVKEHAGFTPAAITISSGRFVYCGFDSSLTGTSGSKASRTGQSVVNNPANLITVQGYLDRVKITGTTSLGTIIDVEGAGQLKDVECTCAPTSTMFGIVNPTSAVLDGIYVHDVSLTGPVINRSGVTGFSLKNIRLKSISSSALLLNLDSCYGISVSNVSLDTCSVSGDGYLFYAYGTASGNITATNISFYNCSVTNATYMFRSSYATCCGISMCSCTGGILFRYATGGTLSNAVMWGNTYATYLVSGTVNGSLNYSTLQNITSGLSSTGLIGTGVINTNPEVLGTGDNPNELSSNSPSSVTQGANTGVSGYVDYDVLNINRDDTSPSMGAYEYVPVSSGTVSSEGYLESVVGSDEVSFTMSVMQSQGNLESVTGQDNTSFVQSVVSSNGYLESVSGDDSVIGVNSVGQSMGSLESVVGSDEVSFKTYVLSSDGFLPSVLGSYQGSVETITPMISEFELGDIPVTESIATSTSEALFATIPDAPSSIEATISESAFASVPGVEVVEPAVGEGLIFANLVETITPMVFEAYIRASLGLNKSGTRFNIALFARSSR